MEIHLKKLQKKRPPPPNHPSENHLESALNWSCPSSAGGLSAHDPCPIGQHPAGTCVSSILNRLTVVSDPSIPG